MRRPAGGDRTGVGRAYDYRGDGQSKRGKRYASPTESSACVLHPPRRHRDRDLIAPCPGLDSAYACAVEITRAWERHGNFELYDDVPDVLTAIRSAGLQIGLISNSARDVREFAQHHGLDVDAGISSFHHGRTKPHASIFRAVLDLLEVDPPEAVMVGDTIADDIEGALALGMRAILLDREGAHPDFERRIETLNELPHALGL